MSLSTLKSLLIQDNLGQYKNVAQRVCLIPLTKWVEGGSIWVRVGKDVLEKTVTNKLDSRLWGPFIDKGPYRYASRFRRTGSSPGVFYCSERLDTALYECVFYLLVDELKSPLSGIPAQPLVRDLIYVQIEMANAVRLEFQPFSSYEEFWLDLNSYEYTNILTDLAHDCCSDGITYKSVRDPQKKSNCAIFNPDCFGSGNVLKEERILIHYPKSLLDLTASFEIETTNYKYQIGIKEYINGNLEMQKIYKFYCSEVTRSLGK